MRQRSLTYDCLDLLHRLICAGLLTAWMLAISGSAFAQERWTLPQYPDSLQPNMSPMLNCEDKPDIPFGQYGHLHCLLHKKGVVKEINEKSKRSCCDQAGECRSTILKRVDGKWWGYIDGQYCPLTGVEVLFDIELPDGVQAVVCASNQPSDGDLTFGSKHWLCPTSYCAATVLGM